MYHLYCSRIWCFCIVDIVKPAGLTWAIRSSVLLGQLFPLRVQLVEFCVGFVSLLCEVVQETHICGVFGKKKLFIDLCDPVLKLLDGCLKLLQVVCLLALPCRLSLAFLP